MQVGKTAMLLVLLLFFLPRQSLAAVPVEQLKAAFIYQFTKYVDWPSEKLPKSQSSPFYFKVLGTSPVFDHLRDLENRKTIKGHPIRISEIHEPKEASVVHVLVITSKTKAEVVEVLRHINGNGVLTITSGDELGASGAVINFYMDGEHLRFEINRKAAAKQSLELSSQILKLARLVE